MPRAYLADRDLTVNFPEGTTAEEMRTALDELFPVAKEEAGAFARAGRGVVSGVLGLGEFAGLAAEKVGEYAIPYEDPVEVLGRGLKEAAQEARAGWREEPSIARRPLYKEYEEEGALSTLGLMFKKLPYQIGEQVPLFGAMLVASVTGAGLAAAGAKVAGISAKAAAAAKAAGMAAKAAKIAKTAKFVTRSGRMLAGGLAAGGIEGTQTYFGIKERGGTEREAEKGFLAMTVFAGALNAVGLEAILGGIPGAALGVIGTVLARGGAEALTEYLEEPTEVLILKSLGFDESMKERLLQGLDVLPVSFLLGGTTSLLADLAQEEEARPRTPEERHEAAEFAIKRFPEMGTLFDETEKARLGEVMNLEGEALDATILGFEFMARDSLEGTGLDPQVWKRQNFPYPMFAKGVPTEEAMKQFFPKGEIAPVVPSETEMESVRSLIPESRVLDEEGNPKVVYHGTAEPFTGKWDRKRQGEGAGVGGPFGMKALAGHYASEGLEVAEGYSLGAGATWGWAPEADTEAKRMKLLDELPVATGWNFLTAELVPGEWRVFTAGGAVPPIVLKYTPHLVEETNKKYQTREAAKAAQNRIEEELHKAVVGALREEVNADVEFRHTLALYTSDKLDKFIKVTYPPSAIYPAFFDLKNPYVGEEELMEEEKGRIVQAGQSLFPNWDWTWAAVVKAVHKSDFVDNLLRYVQYVPELSSGADKSNVLTSILEAAGYDGASYVGQSGYRQWIAFHNEQIFPALKAMEGIKRGEPKWEYEGPEVAALESWETPKEWSKSQQSFAIEITTRVGARFASVKRAVEGIAQDRGEEGWLTNKEMKEVVSHITPGKLTGGPIYYKKEAGIARGQIRLLENGLRLIEGLTNPNITTAFHEFLHGVLLTIPDGPMKSFIEKHRKKKLSNWKEPDFERMSEGLEAYLFTGKAPTPELEGMYGLIAGEFRQHYRKMSEILTEGGHIPRNLVRIYDALFVGATAAEGLEGVVGLTQRTLGTLYQMRKATGGFTKKDREWLEKTRLELGGPPRRWSDVTAKAVEEFYKDPASKARLARLKNYAEGQHITAVDLVAAQESYLNVDLVAKALLEGEVTDFDQEAYVKFVDEIGEVITNANSASGRLLNIAKLLKAREEMALLPMTLNRELTSIEKKVLMQTDLTNLRQVKNFLKMVKGSKAKQMFIALWYNSMLSGPATWMVNTFSNAIHLAYLVGHTVNKGAIDALMTAGSEHLLGRPRPRQVYAGEAIAMLGAIGGKRGLLGPGPWRALLDGFMAKENIAIDTKWGRAMGMRARVPMQVLGGLGEKAGGYLGERAGTLTGFGISIPSLVLRGSDLWFKALAEQAQLAADIYRLTKGKARGELGLAQMEREEAKIPRKERALRKAYEEALVKGPEGETAREALAGISERLEGLVPGEVPAEAAVLLRRRGMKFAELVTYEQDPNAAMQKFMSFHASLPFLMGRVFMPFIGIVSNVASVGLSLTPGVGALPIVYKGLQYRAELAEKGAKAIYKGPQFQDVAARQIEGALVAIVIMQLITQGLLTGPPPEDKAEREANYRIGKTPFSVKFKGRWIDYRRMEPFGLPFSMTATFMEELKRLHESNIDPAKKERDAFQMFVALAHAMKEQVIDSTFMQGMAQAFGSEYELRRVAARTASAMGVPFSSFWRTMRKSYEAQADDKVRVYEQETFFDTFAQSLPPGLGEEMQQSKLTLWGEEVARESSFFREWLPVKWQKEVSDPVEDELMAIERYPGPPGQVIKLHKYGPRVRIDEDLYREYVKSYGVRAKSLLMKVVTRPSYKSISDPMRREITIRRVLSRIGEGELRKVRARMLRRGRTSTPPSSRGRSLAPPVP